jgi:thiosulfate/3-mercaptopyruvate sulfurtransferase
MIQLLARGLLFVALTAYAAAAQQARDPRAAITVSTSWLAEHLRDPDLVLLHVGDKPEYDAEHLPGARYVTLQDISVSDRTNPQGLVLEVPAPDDLRNRLAALGIGDKSRIVVYYGKDWISPATRVLFTLDYAGLGAESALLDGGMQRWKREGHVVTTELPPVKAGELSALHVRPLVVDAGWVKSRIGQAGTAIIDARDTVFFNGQRTGGRPNFEHRTGHIAGARSVYFGSLFDENNALKPATELKALFAAAGVQPGDTVVTYCHIGQQATATLFAARALGHTVLLYEGSFEDWSRRADTPVKNPAKQP